MSIKGWLKRRKSDLIFHAQLDRFYSQIPMALLGVDELAYVSGGDAEKQISSALARGPYAKELGEFVIPTSPTDGLPVHMQDLQVIERQFLNRRIGLFEFDPYSQRFSIEGYVDVLRRRTGTDEVTFVAHPATEKDARRAADELEKFLAAEYLAHATGKLDKRVHYSGCEFSITGGEPRVSLTARVSNGSEEAALRDMPDLGGKIAAKAYAAYLSVTA